MLDVGDLEDVDRYIGERIRAFRLGAGETRGDFANKAGVPLRTFKRLESDGQANMDTLLRVLRVIGRSAERNTFIYSSPMTPPPQRVRRQPEQVLR